MKKTISILLAIFSIVSLFAFSSCGKQELKFGLGVVTAYGEGVNADGENLGSQAVSQTACAVLVDEDGKIVKCDIDEVAYDIAFNQKGEAAEFPATVSKYELGKNYGMVASKKAKLEWFEQIDKLEEQFIGKTINEVKALIVDGGKGNSDVVAAGCTIAIADYIKAVEKAVNNAKASAATDKDSVKVAIVVSESEKTNAAEGANGVFEVESAFAGVAKDESGKVTACANDAIATNATFDLNGVIVAPQGEILTKYEKGNNYGMNANDNTKKEWFEQADAFSGACIGKDAKGIEALIVNGKGNSDIQAAGCTIYITDMHKATLNAAK